MDPQISFFSNFFIKNESHDTIYTFKNYFATVISAISFQFQQNKSYPNRPLIAFSIYLTQFDTPYMWPHFIIQIFSLSYFGILWIIFYEYRNLKYNLDILHEIFSYKYIIWKL